MCHHWVWDYHFHLYDCFSITHYIIHFNLDRFPFHFLDLDAILHYNSDYLYSNTCLILVLDHYANNLNIWQYYYYFDYWIILPTHEIVLDWIILNIWCDWLYKYRFLSQIVMHFAVHQYIDLHCLVVFVSNVADFKIVVEWLAVID